MTSRWANASLDELTRPGSPITYGVVKPGDEGNVPFVRGGDIVGGVVRADKLRTITSTVSEQYKRTLLEGGELLVCLVGQPGQVAVADSSLAGANIARQVGLVRLREGVNAQFISYFLRSPHGVERLGNFTGGSVQQVINLIDLRRVSVPLPAADEQRRIVAILDEAFEGIATVKANAEKNLQNARDLFDSLVAEVFACVNETFGRRRLGDIVNRLTNGFVGPTRDIYVEEGVPYLLARHVRDNRLKFDRRTFVSAEFNERHRKSKLKQGDVLLVQSGHIGHTAVVGPDHEGHNCHAMIVITPSSGVLLGKYLSYFFNSPEMRESFESIRSGSTVPHLTCGAVKELGIPTPPATEQKRLVGKLDELEAETSRLRELVAAKGAALEELKKSLLHQAFNGALTAKSIDEQQIAEVE